MQNKKFKINEFKRVNLRWIFWFACINLLFFWLFGIRYLSVILPLDSSVLTSLRQSIIITFLLFSYIGQFALIVTLLSIPLLILTFITSSRKLLICLAILTFSISTIFLIIDTYTYQLYRFHMQGVMFDMIFGGEFHSIFDFSKLEYSVFFLLVASIFLIEIIAAVVAWHFIIAKKRFLKMEKWFSSACLLCLGLSYSTLIFSNTYDINRFLINTSGAIPLYHDIFSHLLARTNARIMIERKGEQNLYQMNQATRPLKYPLIPIQCNAPTQKPLNLIMIVIDTWRYDMLDQQVTPNLFNFARQSWEFTNHWSGGNSTRAGIFSLFYGIPSTYWPSFEKEQRSPVLIHELLNQHYEMGIFSSAELVLPPFDKTIFAEVKNLRLRTPGNTPYERDQRITQSFKQFLTTVRKQNNPFYAFLFYDAAHGFCASGLDLKYFQPAIQQCKRFELSGFSDPTPYLNRYKNALYFVDQQIGNVLNAVAQEGLLQNTVIIITSDHGQEFNDSNNGYWGHASNFTQFQVKTPLIVYWPNTQPQIFTHKTSHYDISPFLLHHLLGCNTNPSNYCIGTDLLNKTIKNYFIVGSYIDFAIVTNDRIITIYPSGIFQIDSLSGKSDPEAQLDLTLMHNIFLDLKRFYQ